MGASHRDVFLHATIRILDALSRNSYGEVAKWLIDLMYYAGVHGLNEAYMRLLEKVLSEVEVRDTRFQRGFVESINRRLEDMKRGSEALFLGELIDGAERIKFEKFRKYLAPPEDIRRKAQRILEEVGIK
ncbi:MAG: hypothetical protein QW088_07420 [Desulfurococcaceae archaeon]